jgi:hypothetical protein
MSKYNGQKSNDGRGDQVVTAWRRGFATFGSKSEIAGFVVVGKLIHTACCLLIGACLVIELTALS